MKYLLTALYTLLFTITYAQNDTAYPAEVKRFIDKGYKMYDYVSGDLNADGRKDAIIVLKYIVKDNDSLNEGKEVYYPLLILLRNKNGKLYVSIKNNQMIELFTPRYYGGIEIDESKATFKISFFGGRRYKWNEEYIFGYKHFNKNFKLVGTTEDSRDSFHLDDSEDLEYSIEESELLNYVLSNFTELNQLFNTKYKSAIAITTNYFYNQPKIDAKHRKAYIVKGDSIKVQFETKNFVKATYTNSNGGMTSGFLLKRNLKLVNQ